MCLVLCALWGGGWWGRGGGWWGRRFLETFVGAKTNLRLFRSGARETTRAYTCTARVVSPAPPSKNSRLFSRNSPDKCLKKPPVPRLTGSDGVEFLFWIGGGGAGCAVEGGRESDGSDWSDGGMDWMDGMDGMDGKGEGARTNTDGHGRTRTGMGGGGCFPWFGRFFWAFSTVWKKVFHGVENSREIFPWCGKVGELFASGVEGD